MNDELRDALIREKVLLDPGDPGVLALLRRDAARIAQGMDSDDGPPPMLWSGVPEPTGPTARNSPWCLALSVGGTNTTFFLMRLKDGEIVGLSADGDEVSGDDFWREREGCRVQTPTHHDLNSGAELVRAIAEATADYLRGNRSHLERCEQIVFSWGFGSRVVRTSEQVLGGLRAVTTQMTKEQAGFQSDLQDRDIGELLAAELEDLLAWRRPVTVANDGVVALHYFLTAERRERYGRIGLFINGTGSNFCLAEGYGIRKAGIASDLDEFYQPARLCGDRTLSADETEQAFFINYETGSIDLGETRTRFDRPHEYPIEANTLSGATAFGHQIREFTCEFLGEDVYAAVLRAFELEELGAREVSQLARGVVDLDASIQSDVQFIAQAVVSRSALHLALILSATTLRTDFGLGCAQSGKPDLLAIEGSIWKIEGYREAVYANWAAIAESELRVEFDCEQHYSASSKGPLLLAVLHDPEVAERSA